MGINDVGIITLLHKLHVFQLNRCIWRIWISDQRLLKFNFGTRWLTDDFEISVESFNLEPTKDQMHTEL